MKILAFETATEACSVALWLDGELYERHAIAPRQHAQLLLVWADALLAEAGIARSTLDAIAVGRGPGAFTGVRLAIASAQGIAMALDIPVVPVSTLAVLAQGAVPDCAQPIIASIDARMGEVYIGRFERGADGLVRASAPEWLGSPADAERYSAVGCGVGTGFAAEAGALVARLGLQPALVDATALPHAGDCARLAAAALARGEGIAAEQLEPAYLRNQVALTLEQQHAARGLAKR
ncbi:MAG: tRNA (adenosine(37)-N6)-threonylcarbamoyltransferase complex dimerization subunit type 1 TsaB [Xanthomonadaceae bacterium]|nr:tRNA (adenosine(37)-N6)-threonylcarbamoyltransferase complex dimerization subunit type 1 TsaB [Xanthomonadaceae bacterium]MDZ4379230.1 tRNA (adenosine(37)-N6)-threonylcarbamoyltransferase complex dimerization subunit type 1 TsaB [Xanthomonadaceae bacterium]